MYQSTIYIVGNFQNPLVGCANLLYYNDISNTINNILSFYKLYKLVAKKTLPIQYFTNS